MYTQELGAAHSLHGRTIDGQRSMQRVHSPEVNDNLLRLLHMNPLEPLAQAIRKSEVSIKIHNHNHSISLYTDDIILYLDHFDVSVSSIIKEFDNFSGLSGYKINWNNKLEQICFNAN